ncbi:MAG: T9SS type A sorting domain-containing protein [Sporocytophaga sp.]|uniref:T9SS type A sorting domain-containing protein n=1 Tax=Sporocytophaga sp. TaxID=2231183 RepID=UPI001B0C1A3C|nr:T9SS type A sorting domain-containing protein [Sporocytophaga sp.]MBO9702222.1 T9SS type A sorting domain-containing protein [Sporocytophaga sp.]
MLKKILVFSSFLLSTQYSVQAQIKIDSTFGVNGAFKSDLFSSVVSIDIQEDNKIALACSSVNGDSYFVARVKESGVIDSSFNKIGYVKGTEIRTPRKVIALPGNKILLMGTGYESITGGFTTRIKLICFKENGTLDSTFGINGRVSFTGKTVEDGWDMAVGNDGKIVIAGYTNNGTNKRDYLVVRYTSDGKLDDTFNPETPGYKIFTLGDPASFQELYSVAIQSDNSIVIGGSSPVGSSTSNFDVTCLRLTPMGALDTKFNGTGSYVVNKGGENIDVAEDIVIQEDGKLVVLVNTGGWAYNSLFRLTTDGAIDNSFSYKGPDGIRSVESFGDGFVVRGYDFISKVSMTGTWDKSFGKDGYFSYPSGTALSAMKTKGGNVLYTGGSKSGSSVLYEASITSVNTSIENSLSKTSFNLYPNPFNDELKIQVSTGRLTQVIIYDANGIAVYSTTSNGDDITVKELDKPGLYMVKIIDGSEVTGLKVVKR